MTQGKCTVCNDYYQFTNGKKTVDIPRIRARCPKCGEQLQSTLHFIKSVNSRIIWNVKIRKAKSIELKGRDY